MYYLFSVNPKLQKPQLKEMEEELMVEGYVLTMKEVELSKTGTLEDLEVEEVIPGETEKKKS